MSASREKKQRQSAGPSEKALKAQQEQAVRKRKTVIYSVVGAVVAVLVIALLVWRSGFFQARTAAATVGGETITTAQLSYYYNDIRRYYAGYGSLLGFDVTKSDEDQIYNAESNMTYRDFFMETALSNLQFYQALADEAVKEGHTEAEVKSALNSAISDVKTAAASSGYGYAAYLRAVYGPYMTTSVYEKETTRTLLASLVNSEKRSELYDSYTQADLEDYYKENADALDTIEYSYLYFPTPTVEATDGEGNELGEDELQELKDNAQATAKRRAEEALDAYKGGAKIADLAEKYELSLYDDHATSVGVSAINSSFSEQLLALGKGKSEVVEIDTGYYVITFHDRYLSQEPTRDVRHVVILADTTTDSSGNPVAPTDEAWAAAREKIEAVQAEYEAGDKTEEAFTALAEKYSDDSVSLVDRIDPSSIYAPEFLDWVFEDGRQTGDTGIIQHVAEDTDSNKYWGYHLMFYVGENEPVWMGTSRTSLASEALSAWTEELTANYETALASGANYLGK